MSHVLQTFRIHGIWIVVIFVETGCFGKLPRDHEFFITYLRFSEQGDKRFGYSDSFKLLDDEAVRTTCFYVLTTDKTKGSSHRWLTFAAWRKTQSSLPRQSLSLRFHLSFSETVLCMTHFSTTSTTPKVLFLCGNGKHAERCLWTRPAGHYHSLLSLLSFCSSQNWQCLSEITVGKWVVH